MKFQGKSPDELDAYWQGIEFERDRIARLIIDMDVDFVPDEDTDYDVRIDYVTGDALDLIDLIIGQKDGYKYLYESNEKGNK
jgi:hypothetical protein